MTFPSNEYIFFQPYAIFNPHHKVPKNVLRLQLDLLLLDLLTHGRLLHFLPDLRISSEQPLSSLLGVQGNQTFLHVLFKQVVHVLLQLRLDGSSRFFLAVAKLVNIRVKQITLCLSRDYLRIKTLSCSYLTLEAFLDGSLKLIPLALTCDMQFFHQGLKGGVLLLIRFFLCLRMRLSRESYFTGLHQQLGYVISNLDLAIRTIHLLPDLMLA